MEIINPSKHSTSHPIPLQNIFHKSHKFFTQYSQICKTLPDKFFCSLQMVANKKEAPYTHLAIICSIFSSHRLYFPVRIMGYSHRRWRTKWKLYLLEASRENGFYFLLMSLHCPCQQHHPEHVQVSLPTLFCFVEVSCLQ